MQVGAPEASVPPPIYYPVPVSVHIPPMARDAGFYQWPNFAAPTLAITSGHETEGNFQYADKASSLPSTSYSATNDHGHFINDKDYVPSFMAFRAVPLATENSNEKPMNTLQPPFHWFVTLSCSSSSSSLLFLNYYIVISIDSSSVVQAANAWGYWSGG